MPYFLENSPFFSYGSQFTLITSYPASATTFLSSGSGISFSAKMTVSFFVCELVTFFTEKAFLTASLMCASHLPVAAKKFNNLRPLP